ncbi:hypothetical protein BO79DRAFT_35666 [Aspergillus costaricaensis CBS 115574]|uniref:Uncharacterized protein n=1 Tax=Aspergillus costaricaensis CBS 115574 TaxID=1448317 RepID=A0ACD1IAE2_9EURO|nr:hypothetical protein BO79DRAFT_35666 [Aspergillus costaricaensis CBS 115574]RAK86736.1 hypothetical protein BO79DRAFT_35666 [Aspergillus costaricaensis CBS 115574]
MVLNHVFYALLGFTILSYNLLQTEGLIHRHLSQPSTNIPTSYRTRDPHPHANSSQYLYKSQPQALEQLTVNTASSVASTRPQPPS